MVLKVAMPPLGDTELMIPEGAEPMALGDTELMMLGAGTKVALELIPLADRVAVGSETQ